MLPENFAFLAEHEERQAGGRRAVSAPARTGPILAAMREAARASTDRAGARRHAGAGPRETHVHNTAVYLDADGEVRAIYRKIHLFDVAIPDGADLPRVGAR